MSGRPIAVVICLCACAETTAQQHEIVYEGADVLPQVMIDGEPASIHTQGLYVTDKHYLVTGRRERKPKRAMLLRFSRDVSRTVEYIDITPLLADETLDHPGGFDMDSKGLFRIPISTSHRRGPTLIRHYRIDSDKPLADAKVDSYIKVDDHIGAICCLQDDTMIGANWDTETIYYWADGSLKTRIHQQKTLNFGKPFVAIQDWKLLRPGANQVILGGLVKSEKRSQAIVQVADMSQGRVHETHRFPLRDDVAKPVTNEGLAVHQGKLYLLPEDIGRGAKVLRYQFNPPSLQAKHSR